MAEAKRSVNFTSKKGTILLSMVKKYEDIIENIKTDTKINKNN